MAAQGRKRQAGKHSGHIVLSLPAVIIRGSFTVYQQVGAEEGVMDAVCFSFLMHIFH